MTTNSSDTSSGLSLQWANSQPLNLAEILLPVMGHYLALKVVNRLNHDIVLEGLRETSLPTPGRSQEKICYGAKYDNISLMEA